jgi:hypothetical protein
MSLLSVNGDIESWKSRSGLALLSPGALLLFRGMRAPALLLELLAKLAFLTSFVGNVFPDFLGAYCFRTVLPRP